MIDIEFPELPKKIGGGERGRGGGGGNRGGNGGGGLESGVIELGGESDFPELSKWGGGRGGGSEGGVIELGEGGGVERGVIELGGGGGSEGGLIELGGGGGESGVIELDFLGGGGGKGEKKGGKGKKGGGGGKGKKIICELKEGQKDKWITAHLITDLLLSPPLHFPPHLSLDIQKTQNNGHKIYLVNGSVKKNEAEENMYVDRLKKYLGGVVEEVMVVPGVKRRDVEGDEKLRRLLKVFFFFFIVIYLSFILYYSTVPFHFYLTLFPPLSPSH